MTLPTQTSTAVITRAMPPLVRLSELHPGGFTDSATAMGWCSGQEFSRGGSHGSSERAAGPLAVGAVEQT